jgi:divalent metal cation (Fe/Co/Zn/Cd) transporter
MSNTFGVGNGHLLAVILGLALFGIAYNALVAWMERHHYTEGFLSLIVALGVMGTLIGLAFLNAKAALLALLAFGATGIPMIVGSIVRYIQARDAAKQALRDEVRK